LSAGNTLRDRFEVIRTTHCNARLHMYSLTGAAAMDTPKYPKYFSAFRERIRYLPCSAIAGRPACR
jgi:hypothetical protein